MIANKIIVFSLIGIFFFVIEELWCYYIKNSKLKKYLADIPNHRSSHSKSVPRGAGLPFFVAANAGFLIFNYWYKIFSLYNSVFLMIFMSTVAITGFCDDLFKIPSLTRLIIQIIVSLVCFFILVSIHIQYYFPNTWIFFVMYFFWFLYSVSATNFYNFIDGINGYAAFQFFASVGCYSIFIFIENERYSSCFVKPYFFIIIPLIFCILSFLKNNFFSSKVFMGDCGSTFLGFFISVYFLLQTPIEEIQNKGLFHIFYFFITWIYFNQIVFFDCTSTLIAKYYLKIPLDLPHKKHIYQRISQKLISPKKLCLIAFLIQIFLNSIFILLSLYKTKIFIFFLINIYFLVLLVLLSFYQIKQFKDQRENRELKSIYD